MATRIAVLDRPVEKPTTKKKGERRHRENVNNNRKYGAWIKEDRQPEELEAYLDFPIENQRALTNLLLQQRKAMGKTQLQIAQEAGVDQTTISTIERKISLRMGWLTFARIMRAYGLDLDYVMGVLGVSPMPEAPRDPRIQAITSTLEDIEDEEWKAFATTNVGIYLEGLRRHMQSSEK